MAKSVCSGKHFADLGRCKEFITVDKMVRLPSSDQLTHAGTKFKFGISKSLCGLDKCKHDNIGTLTCFIKASVKIFLHKSKIFSTDLHLALTCAHCILPTIPDCKAFSEIMTDKNANNFAAATQPNFDALPPVNNVSYSPSICRHQRPPVYDLSTEFNPKCLFLANCSWEFSGKTLDLIQRCFKCQSTPEKNESQFTMQYLCSRFGIFPRQAELPRMCLNKFWDRSENPFYDESSVAYTLDIAVLKIQPSNGMKCCGIRHQADQGQTQVVTEPIINTPLVEPIFCGCKTDVVDIHENKTHYIIRLPISKLLNHINTPTLNKRDLEKIASKEVHLPISSLGKQHDIDNITAITIQSIKNMPDIKKDNELLRILSTFSPDKPVPFQDSVIYPPSQTEYTGHLKTYTTIPDNDLVTKMGSGFSDVSQASAFLREDKKDSKREELRATDSEIHRYHTNTPTRPIKKYIIPGHESTNFNTVKDIWRKTAVEGKISSRLKIKTNGKEKVSQPLNGTGFFLELQVRHPVKRKNYVSLPVIMFEESKCDDGHVFIENGDSGSPIFLIRDDEPEYEHFLGNICGKHAATRWDVGIRSVAPQILKYLLENVEDQTDPELSKEHKDIIQSVWMKLIKDYLSDDSDVKKPPWHMTVPVARGKRFAPVTVEFQVVPCLAGCGDQLSGTKPLVLNTSEKYQQNLS